jgi:hypothetical protein
MYKIFNVVMQFNKIFLFEFFSSKFSEKKSKIFNFFNVFIPKLFIIPEKTKISPSFNLYEFDFNLLKNLIKFFLKYF